jgi:hypothetical protein
VDVLVISPPTLELKAGRKLNREKCVSNWIDLGSYFFGSYSPAITIIEYSSDDPVEPASGKRSATVIDYVGGVRMAETL